MARTDTFEVRPRSHRDELLLLELLDASAAFDLLPALKGEDSSVGNPTS
jgi:hypothetical protein